MPTTPSLVDLARRAPEATQGAGAAAADIARAAKALGIPRFPRSFEQFLREVGFFESGLLTVYGAGAKTPKHLDLVGMARGERKAWAPIHPLPPTLIPISPDGRGGHYCLDTARSKDGECPVVSWDHELVGEGYRPEREAPTFDRFFRRNVPKPARPDPKAITAEKAIESVRREASRAGIVGDKLWKQAGGRGARPADITHAERKLGLQFPPEVRSLLEQVDGFEHAGGYEHYGIGPKLPKDLSLLAQAARLRKKSARNKPFIPLARSWVDQLCCADTSATPLTIVALDFQRLTRLKDLPPLPFEVWAWRIGKKKQLDPWDERE